MHIAISLCRMMSIVALVRSLDTALIEGAEDNIIHALISCSGLSSSADTAAENVYDGVVSTHTEALQADARCGVPQNTLDPVLKRMTGKGQLAKNARSEYEFVVRIFTKNANS